jgi:hypothetical protein
MHFISAFVDDKFLHFHPIILGVMAGFAGAASFVTVRYP